MEKLGPTGDFPKGKLNADDEGGLNIGVAADPIKKIVMIDFGVPVKWIGLPPDECQGFINILTKKLKELKG